MYRRMGPACQGGPGRVRGCSIPKEAAGVFEPVPRELEEDAFVKEMGGDRGNQ